MPLSDVLFQPGAHDRLQRAVRSGRVPHAYLFTGPEGVGKEMLATRFAALLLCEDPREVPVPDGIEAAPPTWLDACGRCRDCVLWAAGNHPDFHRIHRRLNKHHPDKKVQARKAVDLSVDVIRHFLIAKVGLRPSLGRAKVFIIVDAHRLSGGAQNAMLKTLEEPPGHSYLVLLAASADTLLPTTRSRCHQIAFRSLPTQFIIEQLVAQNGLAPGAARFLAELSQGSPGKALRFARIGACDRLPAILRAMQTATDDALTGGKTLMDTAKDLTAALKEHGAEEGDDTNAARQAQTLVLAMVSTILRDVQRIAVGRAPVTLPEEPAVAAFACAAAPEALGRVIRAMAAAEYQIHRSANTALVFDAAAIELGRALAAAALAR